MTTAEPKVKAHCYTNDEQIKLDFDATEFFANALKEGTLDDIYNELYDCGWGGEFVADDIVFYYRETTTKALVDYIHSEDKRDSSVGFECHVNRESLKAWFSKYWPGYFGE